MWKEQKKKKLKYITGAGWVGMCCAHKKAQPHAFDYICITLKFHAKWQRVAVFDNERLSFGWDTIAHGGQAYQNTKALVLAAHPTHTYLLTQRQLQT